MGKKQRTPSQSEIRAIDFEKTVIDRLMDRIGESDYKFIALGLDMASEPKDWGVCLLGLDKELERGTIELLLPHQYSVPGNSDKLKIKPNAERLSTLLTKLHGKKIRTAFSVDVPFGWSVEQADFLRGWAASEGLSAAQTAVPAKERLKYRLCDRKLQCKLKEEKVRSSMLPIGADKIASASYEWAHVYQRLAPHLDEVDVGYSEQLLTVTAFETYPSAFVRLNYRKWMSYKTGESASSNREGLWEAIFNDYRLTCSENELFGKTACETKPSDAFDAFLCAICSWDYLRYRFQGSTACSMTTPQAMLGEKSEENKYRKRIKREGWIFVRSPLRSDSVGQTRID